jgi:hypothetical protein
VTRLGSGDGGALVVEAAAYRLSVRADGLLATLSSPDGRHWAALRPLAAVDCLDGPDETLAVERARVIQRSNPVIEIERRSTRWEAARLWISCRDDELVLSASVRGRGRPSDVYLLAGRSVLPSPHTGFLPSGSSFRTLFSSNPGHIARRLRSAGETAVIGVAGDSEPGRGHWFFTPAPLFLALTRAEGLADPGEPAGEPWVGLGVEAPVAELSFVQLTYQPADLAFSLRLDYEGHTEVDGDWSAPAVVLTPGLPTPYEGLARAAERHAPPRDSSVTVPGTVKKASRGAPRSWTYAAPRDSSAARDSSVTVPGTVTEASRGAPRWWSEPIFCGWGAQCHLARVAGRRGAELSTRENYERFLAELEGHDIVPGTIVIDDKWEERYATARPDRAKWPRLEDWIAARHARGQRVLLWWNAWGHEGLEPDDCIRNPDGAPVARDPTSPRAEAELAAAVTRALSPDGLGADGLKVDFTGNSPSGAGLAAHGRRWGIALLHSLLATIYTAAKHAKPDALVITHTPHPAFSDVTDMIRLNDMLRLDDPDPVAPAPVVAQMRYRAEVVRAACPGLLVDTDDWCVPDLAGWREYAAVKPALGIPSLYYSTHLDLTGEALEDRDYETIRRTWTDWRNRLDAPSTQGV